MFRYDMKSLLIIALVYASPVSAVALDARDASSINNYDYNFLELRGPNAKSVLAHAAANVFFCKGITGSNDDVDKKLLQLADPLVDRQPSVTKKLRSIGAAGFFGDSTGLVPLASIQDIVQIKKISRQSFCNEYIENMTSEYDRYSKNCFVSPDHESYTCNFK